MVLDTDFHLFHCSCHHSLHTILGFLQIFVMQEELAHQLHCQPSILLLVENFIGFIVLVVIPQMQPFVFFKILRYKNKHIISNCHHYIAVLVYSCALQLDDFKPIMEATKEVTTSVH